MQLKKIFEKKGYDNKFLDMCHQTVTYFPPLFREIMAFSKVNSKKNYL